MTDGSDCCNVARRERSSPGEIALISIRLKASATGFFFPGIYLIEQLNSDIYARWRLCRFDQASDVLLKACTIG